MNTGKKFLQINKNKVFVSYFVGFFIANLIPEKYFAQLMRYNYDAVFSSIQIVEYDKYFKIF